MHKNPKEIYKKQPGNPKRSTASTTEDSLHHLAFENSIVANIITAVGSGKIVSANHASCILLGYSKKGLLTKSRSVIFDIKETSYKTMLKQRIADGQSKALITAIKKNGKHFSCEITSAVFMDEDGIEKSITTMVDMSQAIIKQKAIDTEKEKIVAANIILAKSKQKKIDIKNEKIVAHNIDLAITVQKNIDVKNKKIVADNIALAKSKQKVIDIKKEKIVADNIDLAISAQKTIDTKNQKIVTANIALAKSKQKVIDIKKEKIVADNIDLAISAQKTIDTKNQMIVTANIALAKSKQKVIDIKKEKIVADNIGLAISAQKTIDTKNQKIVTANIALVKSKQKVVDIKKEKIVADNIIVALAKSDARLGENNKWIKYIAKSSYDVMWDWNIVTGEVYVGDSIEEVFGYKIQNSVNNFEDLTRKLVPQEKSRVQKKLAKALASTTKNWEDSYSMKRQDNSIASVTSRASIIRNEKGKAIRMIGATQDVSMLLQLQKELAEKNAFTGVQTENFELIAKLSFDGIWDWNILTNDFFLGEGFYEIFGIALNDRDKMAGWSNYLHPDDKETVEKGMAAALASSAVNWQQAYRFIRVDASIVEVFCRANIIRDANGKACRMIGVVHDIGKQKQIEEGIQTKGKLITAYQNSFDFIFHSSSDVFYDFNLATGEITVSDAFEKEFGYKVTGNLIPAKEWIGYIHPDDKEAVTGNYQNILASKEIEWKQNYRFLKADGSITTVLSSGIILRDGAGKAYRVLGFILDTSKQKVLEEKLAQQIKLREQQFEEAMEDAKDAERSDIGKELHDNVNQLLGASRMYLEMAKRGGVNSEMYLSRSSEYTLSAIEEIRKLTKGLSTDFIRNLGLCDAIENLARDTMEINPVKITWVCGSFKENSVNEKFKLNVYRIVQEQLNNILKHARATKVVINLLQNKRSTILSISDNGVGFDTHEKRKGIGMENIKSRALHYSGTADFVSQPGHGCLLTAKFPIVTALAV